MAAFVAAQAELAAAVAVSEQGGATAGATAAQAAGATPAAALMVVADNGATSSTVAQEVAALAVGSSLELGGGSPRG